MTGKKALHLDVLRMSLILIGLFVSAVCQAQSTDVQTTTVEKMAICKNGSFVRSIRVEKEDGGYTTYYTKRGNESRVGRGLNKQSQIDILLNIKGNLEEAGWQCREVSDAQMLET